jgi:hypothetical protein
MRCATTDLPGYAYGNHTIARSPVTMDELGELTALLRFTDQDVRHMRRIG